VKVDLKSPWSYCKAVTKSLYHESKSSKKTEDDPKISDPQIWLIMRTFTSTGKLFERRFKNRDPKRDLCRPKIGERGKETFLSS
jgi:hypothetical protein